MSVFDDLRGKRLILTGADSGIGRQFLRDAQQAGAECAALVRDVEARAALGEALSEARVAVADLARPAGTAAATRELIEALGGVDGLVTSAGVFVHLGGLETELADWEGVLNVNLTGTFEVARECGRAMASAGRGSIVLVSSQIGLIGHPRGAAYAASNAGVHGLMRALALELAPRAVRVNCVAPGPIVTPMTAEARSDAGRAAGLVKSVPLGRLGEPAEVSAAIGFLISDAASFITGQVLCVDGGVTAG